MGDDVQIVLERLDALRQRFEDERDAQADRHAENVGRMENIFTEVRRTNGRVTTLEAQQRTLAEEFQSVRKRWHDFRDSIQSKLSSDTATGENRTLKMRDVYVFLGGLGAFYFVAKLFHWLP